MSILDKAKATAERARGQAKRGVAQGRAQLNEVQARRQHGKLVRQLGEACYAEHSGEGSHEAVAAAFAALDAHAQAHPQPLAPGRPEAVRQARDIMHPGAECIGEGDSIAAAAMKMRDLGVGSLPDLRRRRPAARHPHRPRHRAALRRPGPRPGPGPGR